ncbi:MAG: S49 family peptidase [Pseudorhodoplanes sp.]|nr:S49 family peptidase [Pseudorhodoplanes sp.]
MTMNFNLDSLFRWIAKLFDRPPVVPVVRLSGLIGLSTPLRPGITLAGLARNLDRAFETKRARAVALAINSPGGSPVQSHLIFQRIRQLAEEKKLPVYAFIEDAGASGDYMLACAGDRIYCDPSSVVGSIGVVGATFGLDKAIGKLGIERRVYASGDRKVSLDPFLPENPDDVARLKAIQRDIHESFIALVKSSRGEKLKGPESALFSGEYWAGAKALELGLVDGLGDMRSVLRKEFGDKVLTPVIAERGWLARRFAGSTGLSGLEALQKPRLADDVLSALEARALWARYGL